MADMELWGVAWDDGGVSVFSYRADAEAIIESWQDEFNPVLLKVYAEVV